VGLLAALGIGGFVWHRIQQARQQPPETPPGITSPVDVRTDPEGATILVNERMSGTSNLQLKLAPGTYRINANRDGYRPFETSVTVTAGHSASVNMSLQPWPTTLRLLTDLASAAITFDGKPQSNPQGGQLILDNVSSGTHTLTIGSGATGTSIRFDARDGSPPVVTSLEPAKDTSAILITNLGTRARVYSSQKAGPVTLDGKPAGNLDPLGVELKDVPAGDHEITIGEGQEHRKVVYETAKVPALTIYLNNDQKDQTGTILVMTGEDGATVSIDGHTIRVTTQRGQMRIPNLPERQYTIAVSKDGFQPVPDQRITVKKGEEAKAVFPLRPIPTVSTLRLSGGIPGTLVLVDGKTVGTVAQDGSMPAVQVASGSHTIHLRRDEYKPKTFQLNFPGGKDVALSGTDVTLESTFGTLVLALNPAGAQVSIQRAGEGQSRPLTANPAHLAEGSYTVTATAPHFVTQSTTVEIAVGTTKNVTLQLAPERVAPQPKQVSRIGMSGWQFPAAWTPEGDHYTRKGGNLCLFSPQGAGTYTFTAVMKHGKQLRWVAHQIDEKNYVEFELDGDNFIRRQVENGKGKDVMKRKHGLTMQSGVAATLQVSITPAGIVQRIQTPNGWAPLDSWMDTSLVHGRFGFDIRGRDEVNLSGFSFTGAEQ
jgi:hypothetical protein